MHKRLSESKKLNSATVHSIEQASLVTENLRRAEANSKMLSGIKSTLTSIDQEFSKTTNGFADDLKMKMLLDITFFDVQRHIRKIQSHIESLSIETNLSLGLLSAELFPPDRYLEVLRGIQKHLPSTVQVK